MHSHFELWSKLKHGIYKDFNLFYENINTINIWKYKCLILNKIKIYSFVKIFLIS